MAVPYTFATATTSIPLSQLDSNFATTITLGNTAIQLGNTVTTLNNMTLGNVTLSGANVTVSSTNVIVTSGNVLVGTTTGPVSGNGTVSIAGTGTYTYTAGNAATTSGQYQSLQIQNSTVFNSTGASSLLFSSVNAFPIGSHDATGGTASLTIRAGNFFPLVSSSAATSILAMSGINSVAQRNYSTDVSSAATNSIYGVQAQHGHTATLSTSANSSNSFGINIIGGASSGGITNYGGLRMDNAVNPTTGTVALTNIYGINQVTSNFGNSTGIATATQWFGANLGGVTVGANGTITNYYGLYITAPTVTGTVTNRYSIYQADTVGTNYFAANVGIGTSSPSYKLHVANSSATSTTLLANILARLQSNASGADASLQFSDNVTNSAGISLNQGSLVTSIAGGEVMRINSSGNVGIGTTSPSYKLSVAGSTTGEIAVQAINASSGNTGYRMANSLRSWAIFVNDDSSGPLRFYDYTAAAERMRIDSSGNVGIGTTSPNASAILDAQSTTKGVRFPNMTTTQKNAISSPAAGLVVFDTTLSKLAVYSGAAWQTITSV